MRVGRCLSPFGILSCALVSACLCASPCEAQPELATHACTHHCGRTLEECDIEDAVAALKPFDVLCINPYPEGTGLANLGLLGEMRVYAPPNYIRPASESNSSTGSNSTSGPNQTGFNSSATLLPASSEIVSGEEAESRPDLSGGPYVCGGGNLHNRLTPETRREFVLYQTLVSTSHVFIQSICVDVQVVMSPTDWKDPLPSGKKQRDRGAPCSGFVVEADDVRFYNLFIDSARCTSHYETFDVVLSTRGLLSSSLVQSRALDSWTLLSRRNSGDGVGAGGNTTSPTASSSTSGVRDLPERDEKRSMVFYNVTLLNAKVGIEWSSHNLTGAVVRIGISLITHTKFYCISNSPIKAGNYAGILAINADYTSFHGDYDQCKDTFPMTLGNIRKRIPQHGITHFPASLLNPPLTGFVFMANSTDVVIPGEEHRGRRLPMIVDERALMEGLGDGHGKNNIPLIENVTQITIENSPFFNPELAQENPSCIENAANTSLPWAIIIVSIVILMMGCAGAASLISSGDQYDAGMLRARMEKASGEIIASRTDDDADTEETDESETADPGVGVGEGPVPRPMRTAFRRTAHSHSRRGNPSRDKVERMVSSKADLLIGAVGIRKIHRQQSNRHGSV